jgi:hypothetical protein
MSPMLLGHVIERERVLTTLQIVGDAMGRPLIEALEQSGTYDLSGFLALVSGGAALNSTLKERFLDQRCPTPSSSTRLGSSRPARRWATRP